MRTWVRRPMKGMAVLFAAMLVWCAGCAMFQNGGPVPPYEPLARPMESSESASAPGDAVAGGGSASVGPATVPVVPAETSSVPVPATEGPAPAAQAADSGNPSRVLLSGDRLLVTIHAPPEPFSSPHVVDEQGRINLPYIGTVPVAGKTCAQAQKDIEREYIDQKFYKTVTVIIVPPESEYSVSGEVLRPGPYPLTRNLTFLQALARAGRFTEYADKTKIRLIRGNETIVVNYEAVTKGTQKDFAIIPGDVIDVPKTWY